MIAEASEVDWYACYKSFVILIECHISLRLWDTSGMITAKCFGILIDGYQGRAGVKIKE